MIVAMNISGTATRSAMTSTPSPSVEPQLPPRSALNVRTNVGGASALVTAFDASMRNPNSGWEIAMKKITATTRATMFHSEVSRS